MVPLWWYIVLAVVLFVIGAAGVLLRRNILVVLMSLELLLNSVNINFIAFGHYYDDFRGQIFAIFVIAITSMAGRLPWRQDDPEEASGLFQHQPHGLRDAGHFRAEPRVISRAAPANVQSWRNTGALFLFVGLPAVTRKRRSIFLCPDTAWSRFWRTCSRRSGTGLRQIGEERPADP